MHITFKNTSVFISVVFSAFTFCQYFYVNLSCEHWTGGKDIPMNVTQCLAGKNPDAHSVTHSHLGPVNHTVERGGKPHEFGEYVQNSHTSDI